MSNENGKDLSDTLKDRVNTVLGRLKEEKINVLLKDAENNTLPVEHRETLARRAQWMLKEEEKGEENRVDYHLPQPNFIEFHPSQPVTLPGYALTKDAYSSNDTNAVFQMLEQIQQVAETNMQSPPLGVDGTPAVLDDETKGVLAQIDALRDDVRETHYANISAGLHLHYYVDLLFNRWGAMKFLEAKTQVEGLLLTYNAHAPAAAIRIEEKQLRAFRVIGAVARDTWEYLASPAFYQVQQEKQALEAKLARPVPAPPQPEIPPPYLYPTAVAPGGIPQAPAKVMRAEKRKGIVSVFAVKAAEAVIVDLSPTRNPAEVLVEIEQLFSAFNKEGLATIRQMKELALPITFNIYTNRFGSVASLTDNVSMLEGIRAVILRYINEQVHPEPALTPMIFLVQDMVMKFFPGPVGPGKPISTLNLLPGEAVEKRLKTTESSKEVRSKTNNVVDSTSQTAKASLQNTIQAKQSTEHATTKDFETHMKATQTFTQHENVQKKNIGIAGEGLGQLGSQVGGAISSIPGVGGGGAEIGQMIGDIAGGVTNFLQNIGLFQGPTMDVTTDKTTTTGNESGSSSKLNDTRKMATEDMQTAVAENSQETNATRQVAVTDSTETTTETTKEETETRTFKNSNRSSTMTIVFSEMIQRHMGVTLWTGERILFSNGIVAEMFPITELDGLLDRIIRPDHPEVREMVWKLVKTSLKVVDLEGRLFDALDESGGYPRIKLDFFGDWIDRVGLEGMSADALLRPFNQDLKGVVTGVRSYTLTVPGVFVDAQVGHVTLDENETALFKADLDLRLIKNNQAQVDLDGAQVAVDKARIENEILEDKKDFVKGITDQELKLRAYFEVFKDDKVVFDKTALLRFLKEKDGATSLFKNGPKLNI